MFRDLSANLHVVVDQTKHAIHPNPPFPNGAGGDFTSNEVIVCAQHLEVS